MASTDKTPPPSLVWFREDLRLADNPALHAAVANGGPVACLYLLDEESEGLAARGGASRWWLHGSLEALAADIGKRGGRLLLRRGPAAGIVPAVAAEIGASTVMWNRRYAGAPRRVDDEVHERLQADGIEVETFAAKLLNEPDAIRSKSDRPFRVFTPYWRTAQAALSPYEPIPAPKRMEAAQGGGSDSLKDWNLRPAKPDWAGGLRETWTPGEAGARERLEAFVDERLSRYAGERDFPAAEASSRLSPHLSFGEIGPRQIFTALDELGRDAPRADVRKLRDEIGWREFAWHLLYHQPDLGSRNMNADFDSFPWADPEPAFGAWRRGRTGYPIVDAAMRQLWQTGWMPQPPAAGRRLVSGQAPARRLAAGRRVVLGHAGRSRSGQQFRRLAVDRRQRRRRLPVLPHLQPDPPGRKIRPGRDVRARLRTGARKPPRQGDPPAVDRHEGAARRGRGDARRGLPAAHRGPTPRRASGRSTRCRRCATARREPRRQAAALGPASSCATWWRCGSRPATAARPWLPGCSPAPSPPMRSRRSTSSPTSSRCWGYLDDVVIVPLGIILAVRLIPPALMLEHRSAAERVAQRPLSRGGGG